MPTKGKTAPAQDEVDAIFDEAGQGDGQLDDFADVDDLLEQIEEDDSEGWVATERGEAIAGRVVKVGEARSDFAKDNENPMVPAVTVQTRDGKLRVIGFGTVLRRELLDQDPHVGDKIAIKYWGEKIARTGKYAGKNFKHYGVAVVRTPEGRDGQSLRDAQTPFQRG